MPANSCQKVDCKFNEDNCCTVGRWKELERLKAEGKLPDDCPWWAEYRDN